MEISITCDSGGNVTLDTSDFYKKYQDCDWSLKDQVNPNVISFLNKLEQYTTMFTFVAASIG